MFKPSLTVHKDPKGKLTVLVCSENADKAIEAYKACKDPGEVQLIQRGHFQKGKSVESKEQIEAKAKAREKAKADRAKAELKQAEDDAKAASEAAKRAKAKVDALKPKKATK